MECSFCGQNHLTFFHGVLILWAKSTDKNYLLVFLSQLILSPPDEKEKNNYTFNYSITILDKNSTTFKESEQKVRCPEAFKGLS